MEKGQKCEICQSEPSKYCCPKCSILYCSLNCYKDESHLECSEQFYKASVLEELRNTNADDKSKTDMIKILQNLNETSEYLDPLDEDDEEGDDEAEVEEMDSDDEPIEDLADRIKGVDLNDAEAIWDKLTDAERQQFQSLIDNGEITDILPTTDPWYIIEKDTEIPEIYKKIPDFNKISSKKPAPSIKFNLMNILAAYSYMQRYFLGDYNDFPDECCSCLYSLSTSLKQNSDFRNIETAIKSIFIEGMSNQFEVDIEMESRMLQDLRVIVKRKNYILACLSDILRLYQIKPKEVKNEGKFSMKFKGDFASKNIDKKARSMIKRRVEYFLAYVDFCYESEISGIF